MGENKALLELDEPRPSTSFQLEDSRGNEPEPLSKLFPDKPPTSRLILPTAGFCVKTFTTNNEKVFINVCHTDGIPPPPRDLTTEQLAEMWNSNEDANYRVPMSIAAPRLARDNHDVVCEVYDVAINSTFYAKVEKDKMFRSFIIEVAVEGVANKYNVNIAVVRGVTVLKKRKALGDIQPHRVLVRCNHTLVQEVATSGVPQGPVQSMPGTPQGPNLPVPGIRQGPASSRPPLSSQYVLMVVPGEMGKTLVVRFKIPNLSDCYAGCNDLKLQLGMDRVRVQAASSNYLVDIYVPFLIDTEHGVAIFDCQTDVLTVTVPLL